MTRVELRRPEPGHRPQTALQTAPPTSEAPPLYVEGPGNFRSDPSLNSDRDSANSAGPVDAIDAEVLRQHTALCIRIDHTFAWLMLAQWIAAIGTALWVSPLTWAGDTSAIHPHVTSALLYGGVLTIAPVLLTYLAPGQRLTRLTIAVTQMLMSSLLIHLSGGRIETHFHIFGSLAFLAFYLDWQVLVAASTIVLLDHTFRGLYLPFSAFGSHIVQPWRWLEHVGWVIFCDIFLISGGQGRLRGIREAATRHIERARLLRRAHYDPLTDLPNRSLLSATLAELTRLADTDTDTDQLAADSPARFACLYIDLDYFKDVNDRLGHSAGDQVLRLAALRMQARLDQFFAEPDTGSGIGPALGPGIGSGLTTLPFLARIGGDEFFAVVPEIPTQSIGSRGAEDAARALIHTLCQPFTFAGQEVVIGVSIGISHYPSDGADEAALLLNSDLAMYHVKRSGRNGLFAYNPSLASQSTERDLAEHDLHRAILQNELEPFYQPIYHAAGPGSDITHPRLANLELLLRWNHPTKGFIPPSHFIPLAEETGLIVELGCFVLRQAAIATADWRRRGLLPGRIAVNVSSIQLAREDFAELVLQTLADYNAPPDAIELEVTETALVNDFTLAERHIRVLRAKGIRIAIDDFGTGYSSLSRLRQLTLDALKIDRVFIEAAVNSEPDRTVIEHIIGMAHSLGMEVVAEGVETETQLQILRSLGCDLIQGYFYGQPASVQDTEFLLNSTQQAFILNR